MKPAHGPCLVRVVKKEDFKSIIETDVHLSAAISKTLAEQVVELNQKVVVNRV